MGCNTIFSCAARYSRQASRKQYSVAMTRLRTLGDLGEKWAPDLLKKAGFRAIQDLNAIKYNHPGGDFLAERAGKLYFITVKARNKHVQRTGKLNAGYNIHPKKVRLNS